MTALKPLISGICNHFSLHPARLVTLSPIIYGVMNTGNTHQISLSRHLNLSKLRAALRRIERFFQHQVLEFSDSARSIVRFLKFTGKFELCLDRTNWKFGQKDINYFVLSWRINKQISISLFATELDKAGNSNTRERIDILKQFGNIFGFDRIKSLLADREFIGDVWFRELIRWKVPFYMRVKENGLLPYEDDPIHIKDLFDHLRPGEYRLIEKDMYGSTVYFAGTRAKKGDQIL